MSVELYLHISKSVRSTSATTTKPFPSDTPKRTASRKFTMKQYLALVVLGLACIVGAVKGAGEDCLGVDVGEYVDRVVKRAREELDDPMRLYPRSSFVDLEDGLLWGLSNLTRKGEVTVTCTDEHTVVVAGTITTDEIKGRYTWQKVRKDGRVEREGYVVFISNDFAAQLEVTIKRVPGETTHPVLTSFRIDRFKDARIEMTGAGFFTWALGEMTTLMSGIFQRAIAHALEGPLEEAIRNEIREIDVTSS